MSINKINLYNNLVNFTRNKDLYIKFTDADTFNDRLIIYLMHFAFFLKVFTSKENQKELQEFFDYSFKQLETSIREIGHGDVTINKKMKQYINHLYYIIEKIRLWDTIELKEKTNVLRNLLNTDNDITDIVKYIDKYYLFLKKNTLSSLSKSVIKIEL